MALSSVKVQSKESLETRPHRGLLKHQVSCFSLDIHDFTFKKWDLSGKSPLLNTIAERKKKTAKNYIVVVPKYQVPSEMSFFH